MWISNYITSRTFTNFLNFKLISSNFTTIIWTEPDQLTALNGWPSHRISSYTVDEMNAFGFLAFSTLMSKLTSLRLPAALDVRELCVLFRRGLHYQLPLSLVHSARGIELNCPSM